MLRIFSYNVNGIRAAINKGFYNWLASELPDVLSLQELKATAEQVDLTILASLGYSYYWFPAEKKGYSGVAVFTRIKPNLVEFGMNNKAYDSEGRLIRTDYGDLTHLAVYFPSGTSGEERQRFKMKFLEDFQTYVLALKKSRPQIVISGDVNIAHKEIDINHPERHHQSSGFLPEERKWVDLFLECGFVDTFRIINSNPNNYSWWSYRANSRNKNLGWRIDYHFATESLASKIKNAQIHSAVNHSDHCPISVEIEL